MLVSKKVMLMKLFLLVVLPEFQKSNKWSKISSMENYQILVLIQMKLLLMVLLFKVVFFAEKQKQIWFWLIPLLWVLVLKQLVELWPLLSLNKLLFPLKKVKLSPLIKINKKLLPFQSLKVKDHLLKITIFLVNLIWLVFHLLQEVFHKLKLLLKLMPMVLWMSELMILELDKKKMLLSPMKKVDFLKKKLSKCSKTLKNLLNKIKSIKKELTLETHLKVIFTLWEILSKIKKN